MIASRSPRVVLAAVVVALAVAGFGPTSSAGATTDRPAFPPMRPTRVLILGDSVPAGAAGLYGPSLPGRDVTVDTVVNRTTGQGANIIAQRGADWDVVVVMLGHNDGGSPGVYQPAANSILDQLRGVPRVVWLSLHEVRPYYVGVNDFLRGQAARRGNFRVADWNAVASANPGAVAGDGLHLNGTGARLMANLVAQQVIDTENDEHNFLQSLVAATTTTTAPPTTTSTTTSTSTSTTTPRTTTSANRAPSTTVAITESPSAGTEALDKSLEDDRRRGYLLIGVGVVLVAVAGARLVIVMRRRAAAGRAGTSP